ncbi:MAG: prepilin-type N-terminal cleavage/methylation domain-containing protein [Phycisphaerales bacterium]|nr:prepilin-type N-terminal cleavage/methylation domain-containing protein [Phycisphaerales bacterium]
MTRTHKRGLGMIELLVVMVILIIVAAIALPMLSKIGGSGPSSVKSQTKSQMDLYGLQQGVSVVSQGGDFDQMPLPSELDRNHDTVPATRFAKPNGVDPGKNTTANMFSILIYDRVILPEQCFWTAEPNLSITLDNNYQWGSPREAENPGRARWDPAFSADFESPEGGNVSYAQQRPLPSHTTGPPSGRPMFSHRGPLLDGEPVISGTSVSWNPSNPNSYTLDRNTRMWSGAIVYADGHVSLENTIYPTRYVADDGATLPDVMFYDEPDDGRAINAYLSIFVEAGESRDDFFAIWD